MRRCRSIVWIAGLCLLLGCQSTQLEPVDRDFTFEEDEKRMWARSREEQKRLGISGLVVEDAELESYLTDVARRLQPSATADHLDLRIKILRDPHMNAFAYPNGVIYIHTGILARMDNEAQLATLLAHEMTHSTHRHAIKSIRNLKNWSAAMSAVQVAAIGVGGSSAAVMNSIGSYGFLFAVTGYSQDLEREADAEAFRLVLAAGYDPTETPKLFEHLKKELEAEGVNEPFFFGTHPRLQERIDNFHSLIAKHPEKAPSTILNRERFLEETRRILLLNAELDLNLGRIPFAREAAEKYIAVLPDDPRGHTMLGDIYRESGEENYLAHAQIHYEQAIYLDSGHGRAHRGVGLVHLKSGAIQDACRHLQIYLELEPEAVDREFIRKYLLRCKGEAK